MSAPTVAVVLKGYPRLSETFIAQEILALEELGLRITVVSLRHPTDRAVHPIHERIRAEVLYLPEYLYREPIRVLRGLWRARRLSGFGAAMRLFLRDLRRDPTANRIRRFGQAAVLAPELPAGIGWLHGHYLHTPASTTRYAARMRGLPFSLSAHAKDIWTTPDWEKREKLVDSRWTVTCTRASAAHLRTLAPEADIEVVYHGLDPSRFPPPGTRPHGSPLRLLTIARAVPKKGLNVLLEALAQLPQGLDWRLEHVGGGELLPELRRRADDLGLAGRIEWLGPLAHDDVLAAYRRADVFVLPSRIAPGGDRDGLPNVLMEALSQELAVVASDVAAIPELIEDGVTGKLVPPEDPAALAAAIEALARDPAARLALGRAGRSRVLADFAMSRGIEQLARRFGLAAREAA